MSVRSRAAWLVAQLTLALLGGAVAVAQAPAPSSPPGKGRMMLTIFLKHD